MKIDVMTLFPEVIESYIGVSIVKRARDRELLSINAINFREFSDNKHKQVDDYPFGGGAGMVLSPQPIVDAIRSVRADTTHTIYLTPKGRPFDQKMADSLSKKEHLILVCGHYEGLDQRVIDHYIDQEISIGDYVLSGGELPALVLIDAITRLLPGAIKEDSLSEESFTRFLLEYSHYTRPRNFEGEDIPDILLSGHHKNIEEYRLSESIRETLVKRPDLIQKGMEEGAFDKKVLKLISKIKNTL